MMQWMDLLHAILTLYKFGGKKKDKYKEQLKVV